MVFGYFIFKILICGIINIDVPASFLKDKKDGCVLNLLALHRAKINAPWEQNILGSLWTGVLQQENKKQT